MRLSNLLLIAAAFISAVSAANRCPPGKGWHDKGCQDCQAGQYSNGDTCSDCPVNTFSRPRSSSCTDCRAGEDTRGQTGASTCTNCESGTATPGKGQSCTACSKGFYAEHRGLAKCESCPCGSYGPNEGATDEKQCKKCVDLGVVFGSAAGAASCSKAGDTTQGGFFIGSKQCIMPCGPRSASDSLKSGPCDRCPTRTRPDDPRKTCTAIPTSDPDFHKRRNAGIICPKGMTPCPIPRRSKSRHTVFECVDTSTDVFSCGGCPKEVGGKGEDCTAVDGKVASVRCELGLCKFDCAEGWAVGKSSCERVGPSATEGFALQFQAKRGNRSAVEKKRTIAGKAGIMGSL